MSIFRSGKGALTAGLLRDLRSTGSKIHLSLLRWVFGRQGGRGVHRVVYTGGRYAYLSATPDGFDDRIWIVLDLSDPSNPVETGSWWWPGQRLCVGEHRSWPDDKRYAAHHALLDGDVAYLGYDDANLVVLDVSNRSRPRFMANLRWDGGSAHTCMPLPGRRLVVATDE